MTLALAQAAAVCHFDCDESSGVLVDSIGTGTDLSDHNTVGSGTGKFGGARDYNAAASEFHGNGNATDGPMIRRGDQDFSGWAWVYADSLAAARVIIGHYGGTGWFCSWDSVNSRWQFFHDGDGTAVAATTTTGGTTGSWHLVMFKNDAANNVRGISVDGEAFQTAATGAGNSLTTVSQTLQIGAVLSSAFWDGLIDDCGVLHDYVWTDADATALWNGGTGVAFANWAGGGGGGTFSDLVNGGLVDCGLINGGLVQ